MKKIVMGLFLAIMLICYAMANVKTTSNIPLSPSEYMQTTSDATYDKHSANVLQNEKYLGEVNLKSYITSMHIALVIIYILVIVCMVMIDSLNKKMKLFEIQLKAMQQDEVYTIDQT